MTYVVPPLIDVERSVGAPAGFFERLLEEDDWSFVIKLHALFEAVCAHMLVFHFRDERLSEIFARLELSDKKTGKVAILAALELMGGESRRYVSSLSELRNKLVHDVRNAEFKLADYVRSLSPKEQRTFALSYSPQETMLREFQQLRPELPRVPTMSVDDVTRRAIEEPKGHIWIGAFETLSLLFDMKAYSQYQHWKRAETEQRAGGDQADPDE
jgi:hypothetical protein